MELLCVEMERRPLSGPDPALLDDDRVLTNLLATEERYMSTSSYFKYIQTDMKPYMRKVVASWMLEVCEAEQCQEDIFPLSLNIMDRFLSLVKINKSQLQLLGSVVLFLASKLRQACPLSAEKLILYTDYSITLDEIRAWELLVLSRLRWDLSAVTPNDFLNLILRRLEHWQTRKEMLERIKKHAQTFITLCAADSKFSMFPPSMIAGASIGAAIEGLHRCKAGHGNHQSPQRNGNQQKQAWESQQQILYQLNKVTGIEVDCLRECQEQIEEMIASHLNQKTTTTTSSSSAGHQAEVVDRAWTDGNNNCTKAGSGSGVGPKLAGSDRDPSDLSLGPFLEDGQFHHPEEGKPETPTDVQEVEF